MIVKILPGKYFEVRVTRRSEESHHCINILPQKLPVNGDVAVGIHVVDPRARRELVRLVKVAVLLAEYLDEGGNVETWVS